MNIFFLSYNVHKAAVYHCDKHIVKMILETAQLLSGCFRLQYPEEEHVYKLTHKNHPMSIWVRSSFKNFEWALQLGFCLCEEYTNRYHKVHKSKRILEFIRDNIDKLNFKETNLTIPPLCMPDVYKTDDVVESYRNYYNGDKSSFAVWKYTKTPEWFTS